jgi:hypothetical protein
VPGDVPGGRPYPGILDVRRQPAHRDRVVHGVLGVEAKARVEADLQAQRASPRLRGNGSVRPECVAAEPSEQEQGSRGDPQCDPAAQLWPSSFGGSFCSDGGSRIGGP